MEMLDIPALEMRLGYLLASALLLLFVVVGRSKVDDNGIWSAIVGLRIDFAFACVLMGSSFRRQIMRP